MNPEQLGEHSASARSEAVPCLREARGEAGSRGRARACEPLVCGPELAMLSTPRPLCVSRVSSSSLKGLP